MNKLTRIGSLGIAGMLTTALVATQAPDAFARGSDDSAVVRTSDDRGRDHAEDGPHHAGRHHAHDDHGRHRGDDRGHHGHHRHGGHDDHVRDDHGHLGDDD